MWLLRCQRLRHIGIELGTNFGTTLCESNIIIHQSWRRLVATKYKMNQLLGTLIITEYVKRKLLYKHDQLSILCFWIRNFLVRKISVFKFKGCWWPTKASSWCDSLVVDDLSDCNGKNMQLQSAETGGGGGYKKCLLYERLFFIRWFDSQGIFCQFCSFARH